MKPKLANDKLSSKQENHNVLSNFFNGDLEFFYKGRSDLEMLATHFIKRSYLEELTELPRMQEVPDHAFLMHCKSPIFISHPWLGPNQPDDRILNSIRSFVPNREGIGIWIDYCCLPQRRRDGTDDRTEKEKQFFKSQLEYIPTILLKSQLIVLWDIKYIDRAWCFIELVLSDIFTNIIRKQICHLKDKLSDALLYFTQTYNPLEYCFTEGYMGKPVAKILLPHNIKNLPNSFYNFLLNQLDMKPTLLTTLLQRVQLNHIDLFFKEYQLKCTNKHDISVLKELLLKVCQIAGAYDVTTIKWPGKIEFSKVIPYIMANLSDFTVNLIDYHF